MDVLQEKLKTCISHLTDENIAHRQFLNLLQDISQCVNQFPSLINGSNKLLLGVKQLRKVLSLYKRLYEETCYFKAIKDIECCLQDRFYQCILEIRCATLTDNKSIDNVGYFINAMNEILDLLGDDQVEICKEKCETLIFHALTISHVFNENDKKQVAASCKRVLISHGQFIRNGEINRKFYKDVLSSSLLNLEQNLNTAVLRLALKVFSEPCGALRKLISKCTIGKENEQLRKEEDLKECIELLDQHTERIFEIAGFSIACTTDNKLATWIRSCTASLEWLEQNLVPIIISYYLDVENEKKLIHLKFLTNHWVDEVRQLDGLLDKIIDSYTFFQIGYEEMQTDIEITGNTITSLCIAKRLQRHLQRVVNENIIDIPEIMNLNKKLKIDITSYVSEENKNFEVILNRIKEISCLLNETISEDEQTKCSDFETEERDRCEFIVESIIKKVHENTPIPRTPAFYKTPLKTIERRRSSEIQGNFGYSTPVGKTRSPKSKFRKIINFSEIILSKKVKNLKDNDTSDCTTEYFV